jgi:hypothetical protein
MSFFVAPCFRSSLKSRSSIWQTIKILYNYVLHVLDVPLFHWKSILRQKLDDF